MKRILNLFISIISYFGLINTGVACEFLKEQIGSPIVDLTEKYDFLDDPSDEDTENLTLVKEYDSMSLCDDVELDNSIIKVFVKEGKIIGMIHSIRVDYPYITFSCTIEDLKRLISYAK